MPSKEYSARSIVLYFPSADELQKVHAAAEKARTPYSSFCVEMIRRGMEGPIGPSPDVQALQNELATVKQSLAEKDAALRQMETELFTAQQAILGHPGVEGEGEFSSRLVDLLATGRVMRPAEIMRELGIDSRDIEAVQALAAQLHALQDLRLVAEGNNGWRWIGE